MDTDNPGNNSETPTEGPVKRKRGRPRKDQSANHGDKARVPPGFRRPNGASTHQVDPKRIHDTTNNDMVGQVVSGVVEASFDAGYLLNVRVGNSNTTLRGIVFKPGHYVPVSAENDVAPEVQMIRRVEIPVPTGNEIQIHGHNPRTKQRDEIQSSHPTNQSPPAHLVASKGKMIANVAPSPVISRGNVVPVVLQPVNLSNGKEHFSASKGKQVPSTSVQTSHSLNGLAATSANIMNEAETKSMSLPVLPFDQLVGEVIKRVQAYSQTAESSQNDQNKPEVIKDSGEVRDMNQPLSIKPLQTLQPDNTNQSDSKPSENVESSKATESVQENVAVNQFSRVGDEQNVYAEASI